MTDNIRLMTQYEINKYLIYGYLEIYGLFEHIDGFEAEIALGNGNIDDKRTMQTINHETIHETLTKLFSKELSHRFDRDLYYNFINCNNPRFTKNSYFYSKIPIHDALIALFTLRDNETLI